MKNNVKIASLFGISLEINISWFLVFILFSYTLGTQYYPQVIEGLAPSTYWFMGILATLLVFVSVTIHELAHSLMAIKEGIDIKKITLFIFGGVASLEKEPDKAGTELKITILGPLASFILFILLTGFAFLFPRESAGQVFFSFLARINLIMAVVNLIPAFPLDGGRILRALLWSRLGSLLKATRAAVAAGSLFAFFFMGLGFLLLLQVSFIWGLWYLFLGWMLFQSGQASYSQLVMQNSLKGVKVEDVMSSQVYTVDPDITLEELVKEFYLYKFGAFPVYDDYAILGLVTLHQVKDIPQGKWSETLVKNIMTPLEKCMVVSPREEAVDIMMKMATSGQARALVMENGQLAGILSNTDLMRLIQMHILLGTE